MMWPRTDDWLGALLQQYAYDAHQKVVKHPHMAALKRKWDEAWQKVLSLPLVSPSQHFRKAPSLVSRSPSSLQWPLQTGSRPPRGIR